MTPRACEHESNIAMPCVAPCPEGPMPAKGSSELRNMSIVSFTHAVPERTSLSTRRSVVCEAVKRYIARGIGLLLTYWMAVSTLSIPMREMTGPKTSSCMSAESARGSTITVGATYLSGTSTRPPVTTRPPWLTSSFEIRSADEEEMSLPKELEDCGSSPYILTISVERAAARGSTIDLGVRMYSGATHACPVFQSLPKSSLRAIESTGSASLSMITGHLPPSSRTVGVRCRAAAAATILPTRSEPVKMMLSHRWASSAVTVGGPPRTTLTASASKYLGMSSANRSASFGACSEGLRTTTLPADIAARSGLMRSWNGKLNGPMMSVTPRGCFSIREDAVMAANGVDTCVGFVHVRNERLIIASSCSTRTMSPSSTSLRGLPELT
mmetsp:Transcript_45799/g.97705  ORF Transcript_45799/g.97705 Transcript_45799/m.97705 type:complete len:384 (-) Transcript_45799:219-1370(-)